MNIKKLILFFLTFLFLVIFNISGKEIGKNTLIKKLELSEGRDRIEILIKLAEISSKNSLSDGILYAKRALSLSKKYEDLKKEADSLVIIGENLFEEGGNGESIENKKKSLNYLFLALNIYKRLNNKKKISEISAQLAIQYVYWGDMDKTLKYSMEAFKLSREIGYKIGMGKSATTIGTVYYYMKKYYKSIEYYKKALKIALELKSDYFTSVSYINMGTSYFGMKEYDKSENSFLIALKIAKEKKMKECMDSSYSNLSKILSEKKDYKKAIEFAKKSIKISDEINDKAGKAEALNILASVYSEKGDLSRSIKFYMKSLTCALEFGYDPIVNSCYESLAGLFEKKWDFKNALKYFKLFTKKKNEIFSNESSKKIAKMEVEFNNINLKNDIEILKKNNEIYELSMKGQRIVRNYLIMIVFLVIIIMVLLLRKYRYLLKYWKKKNVIGDYQVINKIGSGGMADVFKAKPRSRKKGADEIVALKIIKEGLSKDKKYRERFISEGKLMKDFDHPNIVKIIKRGEYRGDLYMIMEFVEGETLNAILKREKKITIENSLLIARMISNALYAIHKRNLIHRDLKPGNIIIKDFNKKEISVKIVDFGLAKHDWITTHTGTGKVLGTLLYMSPEQLIDSKCSLKSDIYSFGVILYQMITGKLPYSGNNSMEIIRKIIGDKIIEPRKLVKNIPDWLNSLILKMLNRDDDIRPSCEIIKLTIEKSFEQN